MYQWLSTRLQYLQCISSGDTAVLHPNLWYEEVKISLLISMYGLNILCGISKAPFEILHELPYPHIDICVSYSEVEEALKY